MIESAVTVCLVPQARQGPFVFHGTLEEGCHKAASIGFDAVEIFPQAADELNARDLRRILEDHQLKLAAMGTGAGWVVQKLSLSSPEANVRLRAVDFVKAVIDFAAGFGAPAIIGSMQGRGEGDVSRDQARGWLSESLGQLGPRAHAAGVPLLFEPLNRYETNLCNSVADTVAFLETLPSRNIKVLCDLFHMNIEEVSMAQAIRQAGSWVGHVHFADSNRRAVGMGHTDWAPIAEGLRDIGYQGFVSAEIFPKPDSEAAARQTMESFQEFFPTP